jgi:hypothetical protein
MDMTLRIQFLSVSFLSLVTGVFTAACDSDKPLTYDTDNLIVGESDPETGATSFVSADQSSGDKSWGDEEVADDADTPVDGSDNGGDRTVEEGDIYRVGGEGDIIFNLNSYRGLQVIDISDVDHPTIIGSLRISGYPVEMYVTDDTVYMLLNNWQGYWGNRADVSVDSYSGGIVIAADISDIENPKEVSRALVPGFIMTSRLIGNDQDKALYVAASNWNAETETVVKSFYLNANGSIEDRTTLSLGGYVADIQAVPNALMVARTDYTVSDYFSTVSVVDVSDPNGTMIEGAEVAVDGIVASKTNMDITGNIMRIVSGSTWSGTSTNHLQTFDISDIDNPVAIDEKTFGDGEQLFATLFLGNKAFFVTYMRTDPFHAFEIDDEGHAEEKAEYVISGWNNFFKPVLDDTRIVGIGNNDDSTTQMAVSLYDITSLSNPNPFIARQEVNSTDYSWSEATWDDKAFSVIEDAVSIAAPDGTEETGLVLLPFSGYDYDTYKGVYAVQMFTFSASTLTRRGLLSHGSSVRRSFTPEKDLTANISETELSLYNTTNPDSPSALGRVELAPTYDDLLVFGDLGVRVKRAPDAGYYYWGNDADPMVGKFLETVPLADPETATPLATFEVGARSDVIQVGTLVAAVTRYLKNESDQNVTTLIRVLDYADPTSPKEVSSFETDIPFSAGRNYYLDYDCVMWGYYSNLSTLKVDNALVFPSYESKEEKIGVQTSCYGSYSDPEQCYDENWNFIQGCVWTETSKSCVSTNGEPSLCDEYASECTYDENNNYTCRDVPFDESLVQMSCSTYDLPHYWSVASAYVLDLSDPAHPVLSDKISTRENEEASGVIARGNSIYFSHKVPYDVPNDSKSYARYYFRELNLDDPSDPVLGNPVNIPGVLRDVVGNTLYTEDSVYQDDTVISAINRLRLTDDGKAELQARKRFEDRYVQSFVTDKHGHALVVHSPYNYYWGGMEVDDVAVADAVGTSTVSSTDSTADAEMNMLTVLNMDEDMSVLSETPIDTWASLKTVKDNKALFQVDGGILLVNLQDLTKPFAQAYFPILGWPFSVLMNDDTIYLPSGSYGIYTFDANTYNLMEKN